MDQPQALVIEDNITLTKIFSEALRRAGYEVAVISDGQAALDYLEKHTPYLILLDLHLPHISGDKLLRWIRSEARFDNNIVFVASADGTLSTEPVVQKLADIIMQKPIRFSHLQLMAERFFPA